MTVFTPGCSTVDDGLCGDSRRTTKLDHVADELPRLDTGPPRVS